MKWKTSTVAAAAAVIALATGCGSNSSTPTAATPTVAPKLTAPAAQTPVNGQLLGALVATLTAAPAAVDLNTFVLQYRFRIFDDGSALVQDSGLVAAPTWTTTITLTPNSVFTWRARAESQGFAGPWSDAASFTTPDPPPAFPGPIGDWQSCASQHNSTALSICVWNAVHPVNSVGAFEVVKRVAWLLRGEGAGLLIKSGGENTILWQGYSFSASRICYPDGHIYKIISDTGPGGANGPGFGDNDFTDPASYVKAIDPSKP